MTAHTMRMPDLGEGVVEVELVSWLVSVGDAVDPNTAIAEVLTDKASVEINAPIAGRVTELLVRDGSMVTVGSDIVRIESNAGEPAPDISAAIDARSAAPAQHEPGAPRGHDAPTSHESRDARPSSGPVALDDGAGERPMAAPTVRQRARQLGIDLRVVRGTGPHGRILQDDLKRHTQSRLASLPRGTDTVTSISGVRRVIAERLSRAWAAPHITYVEEVEVTELERLRTSLNGELGAAHRLTLLPFIARAVMVACEAHPVMNSTYDPAEGQLHQHSAVHLGIATQTARGLLVPVVRDADQLGLHDLSERARLVSEAAREGTAGREELTGSTITITSLGRLGGVMNTPILNVPEVAIVGVNRQRVVPTWTGSSFQPATVMNLSASFDHRIVDGWDAATFVQRIRALLEEPGLLMLGWER